ncbi:serine/threonine protein kinase [Acetobacteraceae bacterium]|nr:serine/threonine protein kinase [Acetobacteraceae bacterium]
MLQQIERYHIHSLLGEGSMGIIYKGYDPLIERFVAVKTINPDPLEPLSFESTKTYFENEIKILGKCQHPHIVQIYDAFFKNENIYIIEEYIEGSTLACLLSKDSKNDFGEILTLIYALAEAISHLHKKGIIHRDLKPSNLLISNKTELKLIDFGTATFIEEAINENLLIGTPNYMSPEQCLKKRMDERSDIFSIASIFYALLSGKKPFDGKNCMQIINNILHNPPLPISCIRTDMNSFLLKKLDSFFDTALSKEPCKRFQNIEQFKHNLKILEDTSMEAQKGKKKQSFFLKFLPSNCFKDSDATCIVPFSENKE